MENVFFFRLQALHFLFCQLCRSIGKIFAKKNSRRNFSVISRECESFGVQRCLYSSLEINRLTKIVYSINTFFVKIGISIRSTYLTIYIAFLLWASSKMDTQGDFTIKYNSARARKKTPHPNPIHNPLTFMSSPKPNQKDNGSAIT